MTEQEIQEQAEANVGFYRHCLTYVIVNLGLFALDYFDNGRLNWAYFPLRMGCRFVGSLFPDQIFWAFFSRKRERTTTE